jgi:hypothetical protein
MVENNDSISPTARALAYKLQSYLKSKNGYLLDLVKLNHKKDRYYWCIMAKKFILVNGDSELYILPWKKDEKGQYYIYSPYTFAQGAVFLVPEEEIITIGAN